MMQIDKIVILAQIENIVIIYTVKDILTTCKRNTLI
jgi:hypothetical protein